MAQRYENFPVRKTGDLMLQRCALPSLLGAQSPEAQVRRGQHDTERTGKGFRSRAGTTSPPNKSDQPGVLRSAIRRGMRRQPGIEPATDRASCARKQLTVTPAAGSRRDPISKSVGCRGGQNPPPHGPAPGGAFRTVSGAKRRTAHPRTSRDRRGFRHRRSPRSGGRWPVPAPCRSYGRRASRNG